jgi:nicotinate phosphoribosyltransferase
MSGGRRLAVPDTIDSARARAREEVSRLPPRVRALDPAAPPYAVEVSVALARDRDELGRRHAE